MKCMCCDEDAQWVRYTQFAGDHYFCDLHGLMEEDFGQSDTYAYWAAYFQEKKVEKKLYLVEVMSTFRMRYVVEAKNEDHAWDEVVCNEHNTDFKEFSQVHVGTQIFSSRELSATDYMELFDKDNSYLSKWTDEQKIGLINTVEYADD